MSIASEALRGANELSFVDEAELSQIDGGWVIPALIGAAAGVYVVLKAVQGYSDAQR